MTDLETDLPLSASGSAGDRSFGPEEAPYAELRWTRRHGIAAHGYDLVPGVPRQLDPCVTRLIAPNPGVMTGPGTNTYLVGKRQLALIDPGPEDARHVQAILAAGAGRIRWILCTHTHLDHASAAATIKRMTGAQLAGLSAPDTVHDGKLSLDRVLMDGDTVDLDGLALRAIHTPGHASNHFCFLLEETRMLFTGDHIMQGSTVVIWPPDGNMRAYLQSLTRLLELPLDILAPGHGYLIGQPHEVARRLIRHRLSREGKVRLALPAHGGATLETLLPHVYDDVAAMLHPIAARSLQAHLDKMIEDGEVLCTDGRYGRKIAP
ncbi:MAG TPA: MBL fold metallo-hydrolase [Steroidobacteraceae bacterium]|nr:MBL fold metallo-hydrolase [Steroidobacteraceae bacterium]